jgi:hypothetical protein
MKKMMVQAILCGALCVVILSCASGGGGGKASATVGPEITGLTWEWATFDDQADNGGSSTITMEQVGDGVYHFKGNITNQYQYGFAGTQLVPADDATMAALKKASAFSFTLKGDGQRLAAKLPTTNIKDYCYYETVTMAGSDETMYVVRMKDLMQPTWGNYARFDQSTAGHIEWQTTRNGNPGSFDYTLGDIKLYE